MNDAPNNPGNWAGRPSYTHTACVAALAIVSLSVFLVWNQWQSHLARAEVSVANLAKILSIQVEGSFDRIDVLLKTLGQRYVVAAALGKQQIDRFDEEIKNEIPNDAPVTRLGILDDNGHLVFNTAYKIEAASRIDFSGRDLFLRAKAGEKGLIYSGPLVTKLDRRWSILMARRIEDADGVFLGVIVANIPVDALGMAFSKIDLDLSGIIILRTADLAVVVRYPDLSGNGRAADTGNRRMSEPALALLREHPASDHFSYRAVSPNDGKERLLAFHKFDHSPFSINVGQATADLQAPLIAPAALLIALSLSMAGLLLWSAIWMQRQRRMLEDRVEERTRDLAASQRFMRIVTNATSGMLGYWESETSCRFANFRYSDWFGRTPEEMGQLSMRDLLGPEIFGRNASKLRAALAGELQKFESTIVRPDGSVFHGLIRYVPDIIDGRVQGVVLDFTDITDVKRLQLEQALMASELADLYNQAPCGYHSLAPDGTVLRINDTELKWLGFKREDVVGKKKIAEFLAPASPQTFARNSLNVAESGTVDGGEFDLIGTDGAVTPVLLSATALFAEDGSIATWNGVVVDDSHQRQQQKTLRKLMSASPMAIRVTALTDRRILYANAAFLKLVRQTEAESMSLDVRACYCDPDIFDELMQRVQLGEIVSNLLLQLRLPGRENDPPIWVLGSYMLIDYEGEQAKLAWIFDVSELHQARLSAEAAARIKASFLANMSHEIRTPMNAVLGFAHLLSTSDLPPDAHALVCKIRSAGRTLMGLLNDTLDLSKIESGKLKLEHVPFRLSEVQENLANIMSANATSKAIDVVIAPLPVGIDAVIGDPLRLEQILINLTANAIKFTEHGHVHVLVEKAGETSSQATLRFSVRDTGVGIPLDQQQDIFSAFSQADISITRRFGGSGLGLAICAQLVMAMSGKIGVTSAPGEGSEFWFIVTLEKATPGAIPAPAPYDPTLQSHDDDIAAVPSGDTVLGDLPGRRSAIGAGRQQSPRNRLAGVRALVVDDSDVNREVAQAVLRREGATVFLAENGQVALDWLLAHVGAIDVVLMEVQMPVLDGLAATRALRHIPSIASLPVIAMTAGAFVEQQNATLAAGMNDFISKPIDIDAAIATIQRATDWPRSFSDVAVPLLRSSSVASDLHAQSEIDIRNPPPGISLSHAAQIWHDAETYRRFLRKFAVDYASCITAVTDVSDSDAVQVLHKMRGAAGSLGLNDIAAAARDLEQAIETNTDRAGCGTRLRVALDTGLASIALYAIPAPASDGPAITNLDAIQAAPVLRRALAAFDTDNPDEVSKLIAELASHVPAAQLTELRNCIENFDFRAGENAIRVLAADNNIMLGI